jgi:hypothetical protein
LGWLPVALLLAGVSNHFWQASQHQISPWLGGGFGMFATTDMPSARHVHVMVRLADGSEHEVALGAAYQDALERARGLPSEARVRHAAKTAFRALGAAPEIELPAPPRELRIEVWRTTYAADTLKPADTLLASGTWPFPSDER